MSTLASSSISYLQIRHSCSFLRSRSECDENFPMNSTLEMMHRSTDREKPVRLYFFKKISPLTCLRILQWRIVLMCMITQTSTHDCTAHSAIYDIASGTIRPLFIETDTWCSSGQFDTDGTLVQTGGDNDGFTKVKIIRSSRFRSC
jgi:hypothetical protein